MAGRLSDALVHELLDAVFGGSTYTPEGTIYVGLSTTTPTNTGTSVTEPSGNNYARVAVTNNATNFPAASSRAKANGTVIQFPTASGSWGTLTHFVLYDASTSGNFLGWGELTAPITVTTGGTPDFPIGDLDIVATA